MILLWQKEVRRAKFIMRIVVVAATWLLSSFLPRLLVWRQPCRNFRGVLIIIHASRLRLRSTSETIKFDLNFNFFGSGSTNIFNIWRLGRVISLVGPPSPLRRLMIAVVLLGWHARKSLRLLLALALLLFLLEESLYLFLCFCVYCVVHPAQKIVNFLQIFAFRTLGKFEV